jgi:hypothetical protein
LKLPPIRFLGAFKILVQQLVKGMGGAGTWGDFISVEMKPRPASLAD